MGHMLEHVAIELQNVAGANVTFGKTREQRHAGRVRRRLRVRAGGRRLTAGQLGLAAGPCCTADLLPADLSPERSRQEGRLRLRRRARHLHPLRPASRPRPIDRVWCKAAEERDIPWQRLNRYSLVQFGHGRYGKRIQATVTSETRNIAVEIASDKEETHDLLVRPRAAGARPALVYGESKRRAPPSASAIRWWSSRSTPTMAAACRSTWATSRCGQGRLRPGP